MLAVKRRAQADFLTLPLASPFSLPHGYSPLQSAPSQFLSQQPFGADSKTDTLPSSASSTQPPLALITRHLQAVSDLCDDLSSLSSTTAQMQILALLQHLFTQVLPLPRTRTQRRAIARQTVRRWAADAADAASHSDAKDDCERQNRRRKNREMLSATAVLLRARKEIVASCLASASPSSASTALDSPTSEAFAGATSSSVDSPPPREHSQQQQLPQQPQPALLPLLRRKRVVACVWQDTPMTYQQQRDLVLLVHKLARQYVAAQAGLALPVAKGGHVEGQGRGPYYFTYSTVGNFQRNSFSLNWNSCSSFFFSRNRCEHRRVCPCRRGTGMHGCSD